MKYNPFDGDSHYAIFARHIYRHFLSREWFTNADVMADYLGLKSAQELPHPISKCDFVKELTKALCDLRNLIGKEHFEEEGNNRNKRIRYIGADDDPLADMRNAKAINDLRKYWQFCQDSAGFFPASWLEFYFKDCRDLLEINDKRENGQQVLSTSLDRVLTNIELLPPLYEAIVNKRVLAVNYQPYGKPTMALTFHPHFLKEYNGRWFLFGHAEGKKPEMGYAVALDRIVGQPTEADGENYVSAPHNFYAELFENIVGVSHVSDAKVECVHIRAHSFKMFKLTETKKIHPSQEVVEPFGEHKFGKYGEFSVKVEINDEFIGRILQMGAELEIVSPAEARTIFKQRVDALSRLYKE
ncbi:MAG: WYL domain-containing protein [Bacteroidales bacterium]|nr:WYL domain-containing protein [Bacteroidales bacterium]